MKFRGIGLKGLETPVVRGEVIVNRQPISFLGDFDVETGICIRSDHDIEGKNVANKILIFPFGIGSTVGTYSLINMKLNGVAPSAILVNKSEPIILVACCVANIPHLHSFDFDVTTFFQNGEIVEVDSENGTVAIL